MIIDYVIEQECNTIIIGDIQNIKQNMKTYKNFINDTSSLNLCK